MSVNDSLEESVNNRLNQKSQTEIQLLQTALYPWIVSENNTQYCAETSSNCVIDYSKISDANNLGFTIYCISLLDGKCKVFFERKK